MTYKFESVELGTVLFSALCVDCEWSYLDTKESEAGYQEITEHVTASGHMVQLVRTVHTHYKLAPGD